MITATPSFKQVFRSTRNGVTKVWRAAPGFVLIGLAVLVIAEFSKLGTPTEGTANKLLRGMIDALANFLLIPLEFAVYRLLLLGEQPSVYRLDFSSARFRRFLAWFIVFRLELIGLDLLLDIDEPGLATVSLMICGVVIFFVIAIRMVLLFPALAVAAASVTIWDAFLDTRRKTWLIVKVLLGGFIPYLMVAGLLVLTADQVGLVSEVSDPLSVRALSRTVLDGLVEFVLAMLAFVLGAQLFEAIGDRVKQARAISPSPAS